MHLCCSRQCSGIIKYIVNGSKTQLYSVSQFVGGKYRHVNTVRHIRFWLWRGDRERRDIAKQKSSCKLRIFNTIQPFIHMRIQLEHTKLHGVCVCAFWSINNTHSSDACFQNGIRMDADGSLLHSILFSALSLAGSVFLAMNCSPLQTAQSHYRPDINNVICIQQSASGGTSWRYDCAPFVWIR